MLFNHLYLCAFFRGMAFLCGILCSVFYKMTLIFVQMPGPYLISGLKQSPVSVLCLHLLLLLSDVEDKSLEH